MGARRFVRPFFMRKTTMPKLTDLTARAKPLLPGLMLSATIAAAASFLGAHYGAPVMLFALLLGMAFNFMHTDGPCGPGVDFAAKFVLRLGVGLLGIRIALDDMAQIGLSGAALFGRADRGHHCHRVHCGPLCSSGNGALRC